MAVLVAAYVASYLLLRAVDFIHVTGGIGLGGNGHQMECYWLDRTGKVRFSNVGEVVSYLFQPCWQIECMMKSKHKTQPSANEAPAPNRRLCSAPSGLLNFEYRFCAPPPSPVAVGEARR